MRKVSISLLLLFLLFSVSGMAKIKVVDRSTKKAPEWIGTTEQDYIIVSALSPTLEGAKRQCFDDIRKAIIEAVAQNVRSASQSTIQQESMKSGIVRFLDSYTSQFETEAAKVPYLNGVSESKAEASYWEKRQDTETKEVTFAYSVKYPFPDGELKRLVRTFREQDETMEGKLQALEAKYESVSSLGQIDKAIRDIEELKQYFFDPVRQERSRSLQNNFRALYKQVTLQEVSHPLGDYVFCFTLRGKPFSVSQRPRVESETLTQIRAEERDGEWHVLYDCSTCDPAEENKGEVSFTIGGQRMTHTFYVDVAQAEVCMYPEKELYLTAQEKTDTTVSRVNLRMNVRNDGRGNCTLQGVTLEVPGLEMPLYRGDLNVVIKGGNTRSVQVFFPEEIRILEKLNLRKNILQGNFEVVDEQGNIQVVEFSLSFQANW